MGLTINTNMSSLIAQRSLNAATNTLNTSIERMTTGYKINHSRDNAAGYSISNLWETQLSSLDIAADNAAIGLDLLTTAEDTYALVLDHLQRIRDLSEQAANGTYGSASLLAIKKELEARFNEVERITSNAEFNGIKLMDGTAGTINLQVGIYSETNSQISLAETLFADTDLAAIQTLGGFDGATATLLAAECSGYIAENDIDRTKPFGALAKLDKVIDSITSRVTDLGASQNRVDSAITALDVQSQNMTSSLSTMKDSDIAEESSEYIRSQILQQASATLLSTANQLPTIALNLL